MNRRVHPELNWIAWGMVAALMASTGIAGVVLYKMSSMMEYIMTSMPPEEIPPDLATFHRLIHIGIIVSAVVLLLMLLLNLFIILRLAQGKNWARLLMAITFIGSLLLLTGGLPGSAQTFNKLGLSAWWSIANSLAFLFGSILSMLTYLDPWKKHFVAPAAAGAKK